MKNGTAPGREHDFNVASHSCVGSAEVVEMYAFTPQIWRGAWVGTRDFYGACVFLQENSQPLFPHPTPPPQPPTHYLVILKSNILPHHSSHKHPGKERAMGRMPHDLASKQPRGRRRCGALLCIHIC